MKYEIIDCVKELYSKGSVRKCSLCGKDDFSHIGFYDENDVLKFELCYDCFLSILENKNSILNDFGF